MTAATLSAGNRKADTEVRRQRSLEELVDRLIDALFKDEAEPSVTRSIHEARRLRQAGDIDAALTVLGSVDTGRATPREVRWASSEWRDLVKRRFGDREVMVYSQRKGRAAALIPTGADTLEVVAALGMRWQPGKVVSVRSLRGLRLLDKARLGTSLARGALLPQGTIPSPFQR